MILYRYITKEIFLTFLAVIFVLLFVAMSNHFARLLADVAAGQLSPTFVVKIIILYLPELFANICPLALFISILLALGRMYGDSEMVVLYSCGIKWANVAKVVILIAVLFSIVITLFTLWIVPESVLLREEAFNEGEAIGVIQTVTPGRFQLMNEGRLVFYVEDKDKKNSLNRVFIAQSPQAVEVNSDWTILTSDSAKIERKDYDGTFYLVLFDGHRYTGTPGKKDYTVVNFSEYGREIISEQEELDDYDRIKPSLRLWKSDNHSDKAELQWRLAIPISVLILAILGVSLAKVSPRQGKYAKLLPAILLYIVYYNLINVSKRWIAVGKISPDVGIWWVHLIFLTLGILLFAKESGFFFKLFYNRFRRSKV